MREFIPIDGESRERRQPIPGTVVVRGRNGHAAMTVTCYGRVTTGSGYYPGDDEAEYARKEALKKVLMLATS